MPRKPRTDHTVAPTTIIADSLENNQNSRYMTKKLRLIDLLGQKDGCTVTVIGMTFDWLSPTTKAAIAGLRKAGHHIETLSGEGGTRYRVRRSAAPGGL